MDTAGRDDAEAWHDLVRHADLSGHGTAYGRPDPFTYSIDVDGTTAHVGEAHLGQATRRLVDRVLANGD